MSVLHIVELQLGPIDTWPTFTLEHLFLNAPTPWIATEIAAFFYGNAVPLTLAYELYRACNPHSDASVLDLLDERYSVWTQSNYVLNLGTFYSMPYKRFVYLSGSYYTHFARHTCPKYATTSPGHRQHLEPRRDHGQDTTNSGGTSVVASAANKTYAFKLVSHMFFVYDL